MFNFFQQARDLISPPAIQMGQPVPPTSESVSKKKKVEDGEMTEEGFVCIGRSSFYGSSSIVEQSAVPHYQSQQHQYPPYPNNHQTQPMYPELPAPQLFHYKQETSSSLEQPLEYLRNVPLVLRADLQPLNSRQSGIFASSSNRMATTIDWSQFDYDFDFERGVIREVNQHVAIRSN